MPDSKYERVCITHLKYRSCKKTRYAPPVRMVKLAQEREIMPHV